jgi:hypothetical protein
MQRKCAHPIKKWNAAKRQVRAVLIDRAKAGDIIPYVELTRNSSTIQSFALTTMLREIATEENRADRHSRQQQRRHAARPRVLRLGWPPWEEYQRHAAVLDQRTQAGARLLVRGQSRWV